MTPFSLAVAVPGRLHEWPQSVQKLPGGRFKTANTGMKEISPSVRVNEIICGRGNFAEERSVNHVHPGV